MRADRLDLPHLGAPRSVSLQLRVLVTDPDGQPLEGATVTFSLTVPGIPPVAEGADAITGGDGRALDATPTTVGTASRRAPGHRDGPRGDDGLRDAASGAEDASTIASAESSASTTSRRIRS